MTTRSLPLWARLKYRRTVFAAPSPRKSVSAAQASRTTPARIRLDLRSVFCFQIPDRVPLRDDSSHPVEQCFESLPVPASRRSQTHGTVRKRFDFQTRPGTPAETSPNRLGDYDLALAREFRRVA